MKQTKKSRNRHRPCVWFGLLALVLSGCETAADFSDRQPREAATEAVREIDSPESASEALSEAISETFSESVSEVPSENTADRRVLAGGVSREAGSDGNGADGNGAETILQVLREQVARQEERKQRKAYLRLCRHAFGREFSFAWNIQENPETVWNDILRQRRAAACDGHFRELIRLYRIEDLRFPQASQSSDLLERRLTNMTAGYEGIWSVYTKNLQTEEETIVHDISMRSASVMKLFVMATVYQAIADGELERTPEVTARLSSMISVSSNEEANRLLALLGENDFGRGIDKVNDYLYTHGYSRRTHEYNGFQSEAAILDRHHSNHVTARDCSQLLERIYHRDFGSYAVCSEIETFMLNQHTRYKIPAGIARAADSVLVGNKTGEMDNVENDVAIVYSPACDYIICIFSDGWTVKDTALREIQDLSEEIYRYYNDSTWVEKTVHVPAALMDDGSCLL